MVTDASNDAGTDAMDGSCVVFDDAIAGDASVPNWATRGTAHLYAGYAELAPSRSSAAGGMWFAVASPITDFHLSFEFSITARSNDEPSCLGDGVGEGLVVAWVESDVRRPPPTSCVPGGDICILTDVLLQNALMNVVLLRTNRPSQSPAWPQGEPKEPYVAVAGQPDIFRPPAVGQFGELGPVSRVLASIDEASAPPPDTWATMEIVSRGGRVDVLLNHQLVVGQASLPVPDGVTGYWGIGAGGSDVCFARYTVRAITMRQGSGCL
jgi:hypothetical protein